MTQPTLRHDGAIAALGFLADDVVFAVSAAAAGRPLRPRHHRAIDEAHHLLQDLVRLSDDDTVPTTRSVTDLRCLLASQRHASEVARKSNDRGAVRDVLAALDQDLVGLNEVEVDSARYDRLLTFFELLGTHSLSEVHRFTEQADPAWTTSLPTGAR